MDITLALALPRDTFSVPVARRIVGHAMESLGVEPECAHDVEVALAEACTNVLDHTVAGAEYEISIGIDDRACVIEVCDDGGGFDYSGLEALGMAHPSAEEGRGIQMMKALVDRVEFTSRPGHGTVCHLEKDLVWAPDSPIRLLAEAAEPSGGTPPSPGRSGPE